MRCECGGTTHVVDGRESGPRGQRYRRRRECYRCGQRFTTTEAVMQRIELLVPEGVIVSQAPAVKPRRAGRGGSHKA